MRFLKTLLNSLWLALILFTVLPAKAQTWQWGQLVADNVTIHAMAPDAADGMFVAGTFTGTAVVGGRTLVSAGDADIFVARLDAAGQWSNVVQAGGSGRDYVYCLISDSAGGIVLAGNSTFSLAFGSTTLGGVGGTMFIARQSQSGQWTQAIGFGQCSFSSGPGGHPKALVLGAGGELIVVGNFYGDMNIGGFSLTNASTAILPYDIFLGRLNSAGQFTQVVRAGGPDYDWVEGVAIASDGTAVIAGSFLGATTINGQTLTRNGGTIYVAWLNTAGQWTNIAQGGSSGNFNDVVKGLALDSAGNAVIAGSFSGITASFGSTTLVNAFPNNNSFDTYVARLNPAGQWTQALNVGGPGDDEVTDLALDAAGNTVLTGTFKSAAISFGPTTLTNANFTATQADVFVATLNPQNQWTGVAQVSSLAAEEATSLGITSAGDVFVSEYFSRPSASFGPVILTGSNWQNGFVARLGQRVTGLTAAGPAISDFQLSPNPTRGVVRGSGFKPNTTEPLLLLDSRGQLVRRFILPRVVEMATFDVSGLAPGLYLARHGGSTRRLVIE